MERVRAQRRAAVDCSCGSRPRTSSRACGATGALFGATPDQAFYVKCDAETNPPEVIEAGQVICEIGIAPGEAGRVRDLPPQPVHRRRRRRKSASESTVDDSRRKDQHGRGSAQKISNQIVVTMRRRHQGRRQRPHLQLLAAGASAARSAVQHVGRAGRLAEQPPRRREERRVRPFTIELAGIEIFKAAHKWLLDGVEKGAEAQKDCTVAVTPPRGPSTPTPSWACECASVQPARLQGGRHQRLTPTRSRSIRPR